MDKYGKYIRICEPYLLGTATKVLPDDFFRKFFQFIHAFFPVNPFAGGRGLASNRRRIPFAAS